MSCENEIPELTLGDDWLIKCTARVKSSGDPFDLTGASALTVDFKNKDGTVLTKTLGGGIVITSATLGKFEITVPASETALLRAGSAKIFPVVTITAKATTIRGMELSILTR